jgi:hypothetical protein
MVQMTKGSYRAVALAAAAFWYAPTATAETFYSLDRLNDVLVLIDTDDGSITPVGSVGADLGDTDLAVRSGQIFGLARSIGGDSLNYLVEFDAQTGAHLSITLVDAPEEATIEGLGAEPSGQLVIGYDPFEAFQDHYASLTEAGEVTTISALLEIDIDGMGIAPDGRIYVVDVSGGAANVAEVVLPNDVDLIVGVAIGAQDLVATESALWLLEPAGAMLELDRTTGEIITEIQLDPGDRELYGLAVAGDPCPWDLNGDSSVGTADLLALLGVWGTDPGGPPDFDGDGNVGTSDLLTLLGEWGPCP